MERAVTRTVPELLHGLTADPLADISVTGIACHSKQVRSGDLFVAVAGEAADGHDFIEEAIARGAAAIVCERWPHHPRAVGSRACPRIVVRDTRHALPMIAARFYGEPARRLHLVGVTGTNGKTTSTYLLRAMLEGAGQHVGLLGTIVYRMGPRELPSTNTTPGPLDLQRYLAGMVAEGATWCVMEASSHALAQGRLAGLSFDAAIFTNLGSDHLDYHKTRDAYAAAKRRLFDQVSPEGLAVINADDEYGRGLAASLPYGRVVTYGVEHPAQVSVRRVRCAWQGTELTLETPWGAVGLVTPLLGRHNVWNVAAAAATLLARGLPPDALRRGLATLTAIPGRLELISDDEGPRVLIDYAHTADALRLALLSLRELGRGRLIVVFGCGGDRDHTKRPAMGRVAALLADRIILTSDNPRSEDPQEILRHIEAGFPQGFTRHTTIVDREQAIAAALADARPDDTVLIAGKGHETYQVVRQTAIPFSDREVVQRLLGVGQAVAVS